MSAKPTQPQQQPQADKPKKAEVEKPPLKTVREDRQPNRGKPLNG